MRPFVILSFLTGFCFSVYAQDSAQIVKNIDIRVAGVDVTKFSLGVNLKNEEVWSQVPDGGVELNGLFAGDTLVKLAYMCGLSYGIITEEYYFHKGKLIFVLEKESDYPWNEKKQSLDYTRVEPVFEERFYFEGEELYKRISKGKKKFNDELFYDSQTREGVLISNAEKYSSLVFRKKSAVK